MVPQLSSGLLKKRQFRHTYRAFETQYRAVSAASVIESCACRIVRLPRRGSEGEEVACRQTTFFERSDCDLPQCNLGDTLAVVPSTSSRLRIVDDRLSLVTQALEIGSLCSVQPAAKTTNALLLIHPGSASKLFLPGSSAPLSTVQ